MEENKNLHVNHRERVKERFNKVGLDSFEPHNVLELLLFYSIPQKDTNELAHLLINRFGTLSGVLEAPYEELITVPGIKEHTATLIKLIPSIAEKYCRYDCMLGTKFDGDKMIGDYLVGRYASSPVEFVTQMLFDKDMKLVECRTIKYGSINSATFASKLLVDRAVKKDAKFVALAHNHPNGSYLPSSDDLRTTSNVEKLFGIIDIKLIGHYIITNKSFMNIMTMEAYRASI